MKIFDDVRDSAIRLHEFLEKKCPRCGSTLNIDKSRCFSTLECQVCHLQIEVSTRNNYRMGLVVLFCVLTFAAGLFLGGLIG